MSKLIAVGMQSKYSCLSSWRHGGQCNSLRYSWSTELLPWPGTGLGRGPCAYVATLTRLWLALADIGHRSLVIILSLSRTITPSQSLSQLSSLRQTKDLRTIGISEYLKYLEYMVDSRLSDVKPTVVPPGLCPPDQCPIGHWSPAPLPMWDQAWDLYHSCHIALWYSYIISHTHHFLLSYVTLSTAYRLYSTYKYYQ